MTTPFQLAFQASRDLAPSKTPRQIANAARHLLSMLESENPPIRPIDLILADAIPPLLHAAQTPKRTAENLQPDPSTPSDIIDMSDAALLLLGHLCSAGVQTLADAGWHVDDDGTGRGIPIYVHPATGESRDSPPDLLEEFKNVINGPDESWALDLLFELSTITTPYASPLDGRLIWPARVRHYEPEITFTSTGASSTTTTTTNTTSGQQAITVVDVVQNDDEESEENAGVPLLASTRHLVLGPWHGISGFRETEVDLDEPPGAHLESWYTVAMTMTGFLSTKKIGRGRILVLGLGGGAIPAFMGRHWPGISVEAVESERSVGKLAERWFGLVCEPSLVGPGDGIFAGTFGIDDKEHGNFELVSSLSEAEKVVLDDERDQTPAFRHDVEVRPTKVRVTSAEAFVVAATSDPECRYDSILVDVYTRGAFPVGLQTEKFFKSLRGLLKEGGSIVVNAGTGGDRDSVEKLVRGCFDHTIVLMDGMKGRLEGDYENAVVVGTVGRNISVNSVSGSGDESTSTSTLNLSPKEWAKRVAEIQEGWPEAPQPPFMLKNVVEGADDEVMLYYDGADAMIAEEGEGSSSKPAPTLLDRSDPAFDMFD
ncbi:hypothetical protein HDU76_000634 [Blyttiomyces sp. JEL0837]|nr:hypothetical protein HDU76_000634 [Blyttiomyces sp. JEL0837]